MFTADLPKASHSILHYPATSIKEKTPCCYKSSPYPHYSLPLLYFLPPSHHQLISDMQSPFYLFSCVSLAVHQCTLLKCIFSNHSSKANCLPRESEPCPLLQEITVRPSTNQIAHLSLNSIFLFVVLATLCCTSSD